MLDWLTHDGQAYAAANIYVPLPPQVRQLARAMLQQGHRPRRQAAHRLTAASMLVMPWLLPAPRPPHPPPPCGTALTLRAPHRPACYSCQDTLAIYLVTARLT